MSLRERFVLTVTQRKTPCDDGGRDWRNSAANQGTPRIAGSQQKLEEGKEGFFVWASEGT